MDWAEEKYDVSVAAARGRARPAAVNLLLFFFSKKLLIAQVKMVLKVLFLFIPLPMFWALFDQQVTTKVLSDF